MLRRIHVNMHHIKANRKDGGNRPTISVKTYKGNTPCNEAVIHGPSKVVYSPDAPLKCGARMWIETEAKVETS